MVEAEEMVYYSWALFFMYVWYVNTYSYTDKIGKIIDCGISNNVEGSRYATPYFKSETWNEIESRYQMIYDVVSIWWHPAVWMIFTIYIPIGFDLVFMIVSIVYMMDFQG